jgi:eukaryotic-like serine/threonine-protein kinase
MPTITCASCHKTLAIQADLAGKRIKCPGCGTIAIAPPTALADDEITEPPRRATDATRSHTPGVAYDASLIDFLALPQAAGELGRLGGYRIIKVLGHGGMGVVFQAEDPLLQRRLAIKAMLPGLAANPTARLRFVREAQTAAAIQHDHIVAIHEVGEDRGVPFIAMPLLKGESLDERLARASCLPLAEVLRIGRETALGLAAAHTAGLVHRDIKPANLWLEINTGRVKILDFGLARAAADDAQLTQQGVILGTPAYMAPEQASGAAIDHRCDLFSLGCVLYRISTGEPAFHGTDAIATLLAVATSSPLRPAEVRPELPLAFSNLVMHLLAKKPEERPASAHAVAQMLADIGKQSDGITVYTERMTLPVERAGASNVRSVPIQQARSRWRPVFAMLLGCAVLAAGAVTAAGFLLIPTLQALVAARLDEPAGKRAPDARRPADGAKEPPDGAKEPPDAAKNRADAGKDPAGGIGALAAAGPLPKTIANDLGMEFVRVPQGRAWLGGGLAKPGIKEVEIRYDFFLGKFEVTQAQWEKVMGVNPSTFGRNGAGANLVGGFPQGDLHEFPVENISGVDAEQFIRALNQRTHVKGWEYRLPREMEWEYACRGGPMTDQDESAFDYYLEQPVNQLRPEQACLSRYDRRRMHPAKVGSFPPNRLGLFDMHGNVAEWCDDVIGDGATRVHRGGHWQDMPEGSRAGHTSGMGRTIRLLTVGLRVAIVPTGKAPRMLPGLPLAPDPPAPDLGKPLLDLAPQFTNKLGMEFVLIPRGRFWMGGEFGKVGDKEVIMPGEFYLGKHEVTQEQWRQIMGKNPSQFHAVADVPAQDMQRFPVESVSWFDIQEFLGELNRREKEAGWVYRLPKSAEWEYACRGGPMRAMREGGFDFYLGQPSLRLTLDQANFQPGPGQGLGRPCPVGSYPPGPFGLCDMHGNVHEWCDDESGYGRIFRGGSYGMYDGGGRAGVCWHFGPEIRKPEIGFRVARVAADPEPVPRDPKAPDALNVGSIWSGTRHYVPGADATYELRVRERDGARFKGVCFDGGAGPAAVNVEGEINGAALSWRDMNGAYRLAVQGTVQGDEIRFTFKGRFGDGDGVLRRKLPAPAAK